MRILAALSVLALLEMYEVIATVRAKSGRHATGNRLVNLKAEKPTHVIVDIDAAQLKLLASDGPFSLETAQVYELINQDRLLRARRTQETPMSTRKSP